MKAGQRQAGVMFVDIADSSRLYRLLGDEAARQLVAQSLLRLQEIVARQGGTVVDQIGDELMCTFPDAPTMAAAATEAQRATVARDVVLSAEAPMELSLRIGFHFGPVVQGDGRIFGATVYTAKRVASLAKARQILATDDAVAQLRSTNSFVLRFVDRLVVRGFWGRKDLYEVIWDPDLRTKENRDNQASPGTGIEVLLRYGSTEVKIGTGLPPVTIGRGTGCDIVIPDEDVSWIHARIKCGKTHVSLEDVSTNGTYVSPEGSENPTLVHRDVTGLVGSGLLGCGTPPRKGSSVCIEYLCRPVS